MMADTNTASVSTTATATSPSSAIKKLKIDRNSPMTNGNKKRPWGRYLIVAVVLIVLLVMLLKPGKVDVSATSVITTYPSQQYAQLTASGYVVAQRRAAVASKATGRLVQLNVREGSVVKQGDILAKLDASDVQAAIAQAQAGIRQAESNVAQANVELVNAESDLKRAQGLKAQGFISQQNLDNAQNRVNLAKATIQSAKAGVGVTQAQLKIQQVNQNFTEIRAPFDGVVLVKNANVGDIITPFSSAAGSQGAVVTMADMSTLEVEADVSESNLAKAKIGQPVEITLDALPETRFRGSIVGIVPTVDRAKATVMTKIRFEKLDARILPEMSAKVTILSQAVTDADQQPLLAVNPKAIVERGGKKIVFKIKEDNVEEVIVNTGRKIGASIEIILSTKNALISGDKLVLSPSEKIKTGSLIVVTSK
jgi:HlyD family secretion protein